MDDKIMERGFIAVLAIAMALMVPLVASGGEGASQADAGEVTRITRQVSQEVFSPYCPGQTLAMCPSSNASDARRDIRRMAEEGMDAGAIKAEMLTRYGAEYEMVEPSDRDQRGLLFGILGGLLVAVTAVGVMARRQLSSDDSEEMVDMAPPPPSEDADDDLADGYLQELRSEVRD